MTAKHLLLMIVAIAAVACGHGGGEHEVGIADGVQTTLAVMVIVLPILRLLGMREDEPVRRTAEHDADVPIQH